MTDARYGWRKNSKDTNVVCIGLKTHRVLKAIHVTRQEETCAQKHEIYRTRKIYEYFESCEDGCAVDVGVHCQRQEHVCEQTHTGRTTNNTEPKRHMTCN